jgi:hypothetical protein
MTDNKKTPNRIPQAQNIVYWLSLSVILYALWSGFFISALEFFGYVSTIKSGSSANPSFVSLIAFSIFSYIGYLWRYTLPEDTLSYTKGKHEEATLTLVGHVIATTVTIALFSLSLWWIWDLTVNK